MEKRLTKSSPGIRLAKRGVATKLANSEEFKRLKHGFGSATKNFDVYRLPLHGVDLDVTDENLQIEKGYMKFSR